MGQLLLVRHGQASFGAADYDALSELGFEQARLLGSGLKARGISAGSVVTGTMRRHRETALACAEAAGWDAAVDEDAGWDEFDFLSVLAATPQPQPVDGATAADKAEFQRWFELATADWIGGADRAYPETFAGFGTRVESALAAAASRPGITAVFTSGGPIAWAVASLMVEGSARSPLWTRLNRMMVNSSLTRLISGSRGINVLSFNEHPHLDGVAGALSYR